MKRGGLAFVQFVQFDQCGLLHPNRNLPQEFFMCVYTEQRDPAVAHFPPLSFFFFGLHPPIPLPVEPEKTVLHSSH